MRRVGERAVHQGGSTGRPPRLGALAAARGPTGLAVVAVVPAAAAFLTLRTGPLMPNLWLTSRIVSRPPWPGAGGARGAVTTAAGTAHGMTAATGPAADRLHRRRSDRSGVSRLTTDASTPGQGAPRGRDQAGAGRTGRAPGPSVHRAEGSDHHRGVRVTGYATLPREHLPRTAQDTVPELTSRPIRCTNTSLPCLVPPEPGRWRRERCARCSTPAPPAPVRRRRTSAPARRPRRPTAPAAPRPAAPSP